jgi:Amt family ammonium transporter
MQEASALVDGGWTVMQQLGVQVAAVLIAIVYAGVLTYILVVVISKTVGLRSSEASEMAGLDNAYHGERGYGMLNAN